MRLFGACGKPIYNMSVEKAAYEAWRLRSWRNRSSTHVRIRGAFFMPRSRADKSACFLASALCLSYIVVTYHML